jgi:antitoxin CptB
MSSQNSQRNRAYWRSRRGLLELDLLLPPFVTARYDALSDAQKRAFDALLDCEDTDLWDWLQRRSAPPDVELAAVIDQIRAFNERAER